MAFGHDPITINMITGDVIGGRLVFRNDTTGYATTWEWKFGSSNVFSSLETPIPLVDIYAYLGDIVDYYLPTTLTVDKGLPTESVRVRNIPIYPYGAVDFSWDVLPTTTAAPITTLP